MIRLLRTDPDPTMKACSHCVSDHYGSAVVFNHIDLEYTLFLLANIEKEKQEVKICSRQCGKIEVLAIDNPKCSFRVTDHLRTFLIGEQLLAPPLLSEQSAPGDKLSSGCVWANYVIKQTRCLDCLEKIKPSRLHKLSGVTSLLSIQSSKHALYGKLSDCMYMHSCEQLLFVPNAMCLYEMDINSTSAKPGLKLLQDRKKPNKPTAYVRQSQRKTPGNFLPLSLGPPSTTSVYMNAQTHDHPASEHKVHSLLKLTKTSSLLVLMAMLQQM